MCVYHTYDEADVDVVSGKIVCIQIVFGVLWQLLQITNQRKRTLGPHHVWAAKVKTQNLNRYTLDAILDPNSISRNPR